MYDAFLGSGSTLAAAEATGRVCYGLEIDAKYVDVIVVRWQSFTGKKATLEGDGRSFDKIAEQRRGQPQSGVLSPVKDACGGLMSLILSEKV